MKTDHETMLGADFLFSIVAKPLLEIALLALAVGEAPVPVRVFHGLPSTFIPVKTTGWHGSQPLP